MKPVNKTFLIALALIGTIASAAATVYIIDSNTAHVTWTLSCGGSTVCVLFGSLAGNSTLVNYSIKVLANIAVSNQYLNTTVYSGPPNIAYDLNGTTGTHWLFGPYSFSPNIYYPFSFQLTYNGTAGSYDFGVNVVQAQ
jgi:hypothetical protein